MKRSEQSLRDELRALCRGWGLQRGKLHTLIGGAVARWANVPANATDYDVRLQLNRAIDRLPSNGLLAEQLLAVRVALAIDPGFRFSSLRKRTETLAAKSNVSARTMRRRMDEAMDRLAHLAEVSVDQDDPEHGWTVERVSALVRFDGSAPEVIERRTIVATADGLGRVSARFSLPCEVGTPTHVRHLAAEVMHGAQIASEHRDGLGHFRYELELPHQLARGEEHTYTMAFGVADGLPVRPYYAMVPLITCASLVVTVRFARDRPPPAVWRIDRVHHRVLSDPFTPGDELLEVNGAGEVTVSFASLKPGFGYGMGWALRHPERTGHG